MADETVIRKSEFPAKFYQFSDQIKVTSAIIFTGMILPLPPHHFFEAQPVVAGMVIGHLSKLFLLSFIFAQNHGETSRHGREMFTSWNFSVPLPLVLL